MFEALLIIFATGVCGAIMLFASQSRWLDSIVTCAMGGVTFAYLLAFVINPPTLLTVAMAILFTALLVWLGKQ